MGFNERIRGKSSHLLSQNIIEIINLQPLSDGKAKTLSGQRSKKFYYKI